MNRLRILFIILPVLFTAQSCNLFGDVFGSRGAGSRGVYRSTDGGQAWEAANKVSKKDDLNSAVISRLVIEQSDPRSILAATQNQGLYGSDNHGENWVSLLPELAAYDAAFNPIKSDEIFAAGARARLGVIYRSPDRAGTWVEVYSEPTGPSAVTTLLLDTQNPKVLYAGLSTGALIKSADSGETWKALGNLKDRVISLQIGFDSSRTLYALTRANGLQRSSDGGITWAKMVVSDESKTYYDLALARKNPAALHLATSKGLYQTLDGGASWTKLSLPASPEFTTVSAAAVNPDNERQIFAAIRSTIYRSDDRGLTWHTANLSTRRTVSGISINPLEPNRVYAGTQ